MLGWLLAFDVVGVVLSLLVDMVIVLHRRWEGSSPLAYVIWFVVGVFCAVFIYLRRTGDDGPETDAGRQTGLLLVVVTSVVAFVLGLLSSLFWSGSDATEAIAPDHRGVTITYLITVVLTVVWMRFVLFRRLPAVESNSGPTPVSIRSARKTGPRLHDLSKKLDLGVEGGGEGAEVFRPAGFWQTLAFLIGVPVLLFLDVGVYLLGPLDYFDRWTDPLLTTSLVGGLVWGFAAARWKSARDGLLTLHAPLLVGTVFYFFAVILGGLLVGFGLPERVSEIASYIAFGLGFVLGAAAIIGWLAEFFE